MPSGVYEHNISKLLVQINAMANANRGKPRLDTVKLKISVTDRVRGIHPPSAKGRKWSLESRQRWSEKQKGSGAAWFGRHHSIETKRKLSELRKGDKGANWKGGITNINELERHSVEFKLWRMNIFTRDNYTCQKCNQHGGRLHPHHIKSFALFPKTRYDIDNGITLCNKCHLQTNNYGGRAIFQLYQERQNNLLTTGEKEE